MSHPAATAPSLTVIPAGATLCGDVLAPGDALIAGRVTGEVQVAGRLTLEPTGRIDGAVVAAHAALHGQAGSDVSVRGQTELFPGTQVAGVLSTCELTARHGARFEGQLVLGPATASGAVPESIPAPVSAAPAAPAVASAASLIERMTVTQPPAPRVAATPPAAPAALPFTAVPGAACAGLRLRAPAS